VQNLRQGSGADRGRVVDDQAGQGISPINTLKGGDDRAKA
jgi:hypothetical protein